MSLPPQKLTPRGSSSDRGPAPAALLSETLGTYRAVDDPLEPGLRQSVLAEWPSAAAT